MSHFSPVAPTAPRKRQRLYLPESKLRSLEEWASDGTGLTAAAFVKNPDDQVALVKNPWADGWFLPGVAVEIGESPVEAAKREVKEETGLVATIETPLLVLDQSYVSEQTGEKWFSAEFVVYSAHSDGPIPDVSQLGVHDKEISAARWFDSIPDNLHDDEYLRPYL